MPQAAQQMQMKQSKDAGHSAQQGLLKDECPEVFAQLHPTLYGDLQSAERLTSGSNKRLWWLCTANCNRPAGCKCEHAWQAKVSHRCLLSQGCPFCNGKRVCACKSISTDSRLPGILEIWHFRGNSDISPEQAAPYGQKEVWGRHTCPRTGEEHEWQAAVKDVTSVCMLHGRPSCPVCWHAANGE